MATPTVESKKSKMFGAVPALLALAVFLGLAVSVLGAGGPKVAASTAPGATAASGQSTVAVATLDGPGSKCSKITGTVVAGLGAPNPDDTIPAAGSIGGGNINGPVSATILQIHPSSDGTLHLLMEHHYTNSSPLGQIDTSDRATLAPVDAAAGWYWMENRLRIVGASGVYSGARGDIRTYGVVNLGTGSIHLSLIERVCVES